MFNTPAGPTLLGIDVIWVGTILAGVAAAAVLVFLHSIGAFGVLLMVGGSIPGETKVASIAIYEAVEMMNYEAAGLIALSFIPISYAFLLLINRLNARAGA